MCRFSYDGEKFTHFLLSWQIFHADEVPWFIHCSSMFPVKRTTDLGEADRWGWWLVLVMRCSFGYLAPARGGTSTSRVMVTGQLPSSFSLCTEIIRWQQINFSRFMKELRSWSRFAEYLNYTPSAQTRAAATVSQMKRNLHFLLIPSFFLDMSDLEISTQLHRSRYRCLSCL